MAEAIRRRLQHQALLRSELYLSSRLLLRVLQEDALVVADPLAMQYIFSSGNFQHDPMFKQIIYLMEGDLSLSYVEGTSVPQAALSNLPSKQARLMSAFV